jgi:hypothetical protein
VDSTVRILENAHLPKPGVSVQPNNPLCDIRLLLTGVMNRPPCDLPACIECNWELVAPEMQLRALLLRRPFEVRSECELV